MTRRLISGDAMTLIEWDGSLAIGHERIDAQHRGLVFLINRLHALTSACTGQEDLKPVMLELYKYTLFHFGEEESLMAQAGYDGLTEHYAEHDAFVSRLDALAEKVRHGEDCLGNEIFHWLAGWLLDHIAVTDKRLADCLTALHKP